MRSERRTIILQVLLFIITFITTTLAGGEWCFGISIYTYSETGIGINSAYRWADFVRSMGFSIPLLLILTVHEFGHYFTARYHRVNTSLPYFLPFPPLPLVPSIGTFGAVIRLREKVRSSVQNFDIGLAGPMAGFIMTLVVLAYGFYTLPAPDYVFEFHPEYKQYGLNYADHVYSQEYYDKHLKDKVLLDMQVGTTLLMEGFKMLAPDQARVPNAHELMHYPILLASVIALFFMCLNLLPIGQLDGGHITYGLLGSRKHTIIGRVFLVMLLAYAGFGVVTPLDGIEGGLGWGIVMVLLYYSCFRGFARSKQDAIMYALLLFAAQFLLSWALPGVIGYPGWLLFAFMVGRFIGVHYPPAEIEAPLDTKRVIMGWLSIVVFIVSFSPVPITLNEVGSAVQDPIKKERRSPEELQEPEDSDDEESNDKPKLFTETELTDDELAG